MFDLMTIIAALTIVIGSAGVLLILHLKSRKYRPPTDMSDWIPPEQRTSNRT